MLPVSTLLLSFLAALACAVPLAPSTPLAAAPPRGPVTQEVGPVADPAADAGELLVKEFGVDLQSWNTRRVQLSRGGRTPDPKALGPHPATTYRARFQALVEKKNGWAQVWWLDNLQHLTDAADVAGKKRTFVELFDALVPRDADRPYVMYVLGAIQAHTDLLGPKTAGEMLERLGGASTNPEVQARAAHMRAGLHAQPGAVADPARIEEAHELHRQVVMSWPGTSAARESAGILVPVVQRDFEQREREWLARCFELQRAGRPPSEWPRQPLFDVQSAMLPFVKADQPSAVRWTQRFLPAVLGQEAHGLAPFLTRLAIELGQGYPIGTDSLQSVRLGLVELLLRQFPREACIDDLLADLARNAETLDPVLLAPAFAPLLEGADARQKAIAFHVLVRASLARGEWKHYLEAVEWGTRLERECAGDPLVAATEPLVAGVRAILPGQPAPDFEAQDAEKKRFKLSDYRGRVVLLAFYSLFLDKGLEDVSTWQAFQARHFRRPFAMLGANTGATDPQSYTDRATAKGMSWRTALLFQATPEAIRPWLVRRYPTVVVIDADGIIRGRDLPWPETQALLEQLIAETEAKAGPK